MFFCSRPRDSALVPVGHLPHGWQEPRIDAVTVNAARSPLAGQNALACQFSQMTRHGALADASGGGEGPHARKTSAGAIGEGDKVLQGPAQRRAQRAVQIETDGDVSEQRMPPGCSTTRPEAAYPEHTSPVARNGACENR